jgi:hypothetical protein
MMRTPAAAWFIFAVSILGGYAGAPSAFAQDHKPSIFIGPVARDGFLDVDAGVRDSIRDIQQEVRNDSQFTVAENRDQAALVLLVVGRGILMAGSVGIASSSAYAGYGLVVPGEKPTLTTLLSIGKYAKALQSTGGTWTAAAGAVVRDLSAWWEANREAVERRSEKQRTGHGPKATDETHEL